MHNPLRSYVMYELIDTGQRSYIKAPYHMNIAKVIIRAANARGAGYARYWTISESELLCRLVGGE